MTRIPQPSETTMLRKGIVGAEFATVMMNRLYQADGTVPGFIYCGAYSAGGFNMNGFGPARELARRGYPVISGDCGDTPTGWGRTDGPGVWGKDASMTLLDSYKTYLQGTLGAKTGKIGILYGSHGCALAYNWARANPTAVYCIAGAIGTCDVEDIRANNRNSFQASIEAAYTNNATWQAARATHNPVEYVSSLSIPQLDYYSTDDAVADNGSHADHDAFKTAAGANMTQRSLGAIGHNTGGLLTPGTTDTVAFCDWVVATLT